MRKFSKIIASFGLTTILVVSFQNCSEMITEPINGTSCAPNEMVTLENLESGESITICGPIPDEPTPPPVITENPPPTGNPPPTVPPLPQSCTLPSGQVIASGSSALTFYEAKHVAFGQTCQSQMRTCTDGVLSGQYTHSDCTIWKVTQDWSSCAEQYGTCTQTRKVDCYNSNNVKVNNSLCTTTKPPETRTVELGPAPSCQLPWGGSIPAGASPIRAYETSKVTFEQSCKSQMRSCLTSSTLSGSYQFQHCHQWTVTSDWTECTNTCGDCIQTRQIVCRRMADSNTVADSNCLGTKPATQKIVELPACTPPKKIPLSVPIRKKYVGAYKVLVVPVRLATDSPNPVSPNFNNSTIKQRISGTAATSVSSLLKKETANRVSIDTVVFTPIQNVPQRCGVGEGSDGPSLFQLGRDLIQQNPNLYGSVSDYIAIISLLPSQGDCGTWSGAASDGAMWLYYYEDAQHFSAVVTHELLHIMGLGHSSTIYRKPNTYITQGICNILSICPEGTANFFKSYADRSSMMSSAMSNDRLLESEKEAIGQLSGVNVTLGTPKNDGTGVYRIFTRGLPATQSKPTLVKIPIIYSKGFSATGRNFISLEYDSHPTGLAASSSFGNYKGVQVRYIDDGGGSYMDALSGASKPRVLAVVGDEFLDPINNVKVELIALGFSGNIPVADVEITKIQTNVSLLPKPHMYIQSVNPIGCDKVEVKFKKPAGTIINDITMTYINYFLNGKKTYLGCRVSGEIKPVNVSGDIWSCTFSNTTSPVVNLKDEHVITLVDKKMSQSIVVPSKVGCTGP